MEIFYISLLVLGAATFGTLTGFGISTIMTPVLLLFFSLAETLVFVGVIHWFGDIWKVVLFREGLNWKLILGFGIPGIAASYIGASLAFEVPERLLTKILGGFLLGYVVFLFFKSDFRLSKSVRNMITGGALSGFFAGIFGVGGAVRASFLSAFDLPKAVYLATAGSIALLIDSTRLVTYVSDGARLEEKMLWGMIAFVPISFVGAWIAKRIVDFIPQRFFRLVICVFLGSIGVYFLLFKSY